MWLRNVSIGLVICVTASVAVAEDPAWLGVVVTGDDGPGARIVAVIPDGPAARAGVRSGDVLIRLGEFDLAGTEDLERRLRSIAVGEPLSFVIRRDGRTLDGTIVAVARSSRPTLPFPPPIRPDDAPGPGIEAIAIPESLRSHYGAPEDAGVLVGSIAPGSRAADAGLRVGDVVIAVEGSAVRSPDDLRSRFATRAPGATVEVAVVRPGSAGPIRLLVPGATSIPSPPTAREVRIRVLEQEIERLERRLDRLRQERERLARTADAPL